MNPPANLQLLTMDPETGEVVKDPRDARIAALEEEVARLEKVALEAAKRESGVRSQMAMMRGEQIEKAKAGPLADRAWRLIDAWQKLCNHMGCAADDKRFDITLEALKRRKKVGTDMDDAEAELRKALFGASVRPYFVNFEHLPEGKPSQRKDEIKYVLRGEDQITKFGAFAQEHAEHMLDAMVRPLVHAYGQGVEASRDPLSNEVEGWRSTCPVCEQEFALWLAVAFSADLQWIRLACSAGCERDAVRDRLRAMYADGARAAA